MTKASEVNVSDAELFAFLESVEQHTLPSLEAKEAFAKALAAFLAARVPDAVTDQGDDSYQSFGVWESGHNALRAAVLRGPG